MKDTRLTLLIFSMIANVHAHAGQGNENERNIEYIISHGNIIYGDTDINLAHEDAMLRNGKDITHYPPNQIEKIAVRERTGEIRLYFSGAFGLNNEQHLFEILSEGRRTLLFREGLKFSAYDETVYSPYFLLVEGRIYALSNNKKELCGQIDKGMQKELSIYIKDQKISLEDKAGLIRLFDHYNTSQMAK